MPMKKCVDNIEQLIKNLLQNHRECEWVEFKHNNSSPNEIGEYISALANSAVLAEQPNAYLLWGIADDIKVVGTSFNPFTAKKGNEDLINWLSASLKPRINFKFDTCIIDGKNLVVLTIPASYDIPTQFFGIEYVRVGSHKKKLSDHPEKAKVLWNLLSRGNFEKGNAIENVTADDVVVLLNYPKYFSLLSLPLPDGRDKIIEKFISEKFVTKKIDGHYDITNLGAILFAVNLNKFESISRKLLRIIIYNGKNKVSTILEQIGTKGYASGFDGIIHFINSRLPRNEIIGEAFRKEVLMYPEIAIRELVANALIHQDFLISGTGPTVEIFEDRIEITNPGKPLINPLRFMDEPPRTRNEMLAKFMRRAGICEERGSGIDKVVDSVEYYQLPAPDFREKTENTVSILYAYKPFSEMDKDDRIRACYQHACLCHLSNTKMTNSSLRKRFGLEDKSYTTASKIIKDTLTEGLIKTLDQASDSKKDVKYLPYWA